MDTNAMLAASKKSGIKSRTTGTHQPRSAAGSRRFVSLFVTITTT